MHKKIKSISEIIGKEKEFSQIRQAAEDFGVIDKFNEIFPDLKLVAKAVKVDRSTLFLKVENSVWRSELNFNKSTMIEKINKRFKKSVIKNIKFIS